MAQLNTTDQEPRPAMPTMTEPATHQVIAESSPDGPYVAIGEDLRAYQALIAAGYPDTLATARLLQTRLYDPAYKALRRGALIWSGTVHAGRYPAVEFTVERR